MTLARTATPDHEVEITLELVAALLSTQLPALASEQLTMGPSGWDNVLVRIGDDFAARLPRRQLAADISASEHHWLPLVGAGWSFRAPVPIAVCEPDAALGYPWRWSVVPWLAGESALDAPLSEEGAADLGRALAEVHIAAPAGAPLNPFRSQPLAQRRERTEARLAVVEAARDWSIDRAGVHAALEGADPWQGGTWCHLDLHGNNVLTSGGRLAGVLDWGDSGAGDAATDLGESLYMLGSAGFEVMASAYRKAGGTGDPFAPRVRAEAIAYAITMASLEEEAYAASGWRALEGLGVAKRAG